MTRIARTALLACACIGASSYLVADERGSFFVGAGVAQSSLDGTSRAQPNVFSTPLPLAMSIDGLPFDDEAGSWQVSGGYALRRWFELEAAYADLGELQSVALAPGLGSAATRVPLEVATWQLGAKLRYPFTPAFSAVVRAAVLRASFETGGTMPLLISTSDFPPGSFFTPVNPASGNPSLRPPGSTPLFPLQPGTPIIIRVPVTAPEDETGWAWGVGLGWQIQPRWRAELNWRQQDVRVNQISTVGIELAWSLR